MAGEMPRTRLIRLLQAGVCALVLPLAGGADAPARAGSTTRTLAGTGVAGNADGPALSASFMLPTVVRYGPGGTLYILDTAGQRVRALSPGGTVSTVAGGGSPTSDGLAVAGSFADGPAHEARFNDPMGLAVGSDGALYVADTDNRCIRRIADGIVTTFAGKPGLAGHDDGPRASATFTSPQGLAFDQAGTLWIADNGVGVRRLGRDGAVDTPRVAPPGDLFFDVASWGSGAGQRLFLAGSKGITVYDPAAATTQVFSVADESGGTYAPYALAPLGRDQLLAVDPGFNVLRYVRLARPPFMAYSLQRVVAGSPLAADDETGGYRDGPPGEALFSSPTGLALARNGDVAIADAGNRRVRLVSAFDPRRALDEPVAPALDRADYNVLYVGNSFAFWNSLWGDSIPGLIERGLNADRAKLGIPRRVQVTAARFDGSGITAQASFIREALADSHTDLVVWSFNSFDVGAEGRQYPERSTEAEVLLYLTKTLREVRDALHQHGIALVAAAQPVGISVAPTEETFGKLTISAYRPFEGNLTAERRVERAIEAAGVPEISTLDAFIEAERADRPRPLFESTRGGIHFTPAGNAFYSALLLRGLTRLKPWGGS